MAARSIATATISFGLVSVPVNLYSSAESKASVSFNMLHKKCGARLKQQYICPKDNKKSSTRDDTVKGYEFAKDQYVVLTPKSSRRSRRRRRARSTSSSSCRSPRSIASTSRRSTTSAPTRAATARIVCSPRRSRRPGKAALGQYAARGQQHLVLLRPLNGVLVMEQLHYADEVRSDDRGAGSRRAK